MMTTAFPWSSFAVHIQQTWKFKERNLGISKSRSMVQLEPGD